MANFTRVSVRYRLVHFLPIRIFYSMTFNRHADRIFQHQYTLKIYTIFNGKNVANEYTSQSETVLLCIHFVTNYSLWNSVFVLSELKRASL